MGETLKGLLYIGVAVIPATGYLFMDMVFYFKSKKSKREIFFKRKFALKTIARPYIALVIRIYPAYQRLSETDKLRFQNRMVNFLNRYDIISKGNLNLKPEDKILIAASYTKLTFGYKNYLIGSFNKIVIYPDAFLYKPDNQYHIGQFNPSQKALVFSWKDFLEGYQNTADGRNLALHEFTHALMFYFASPRKNNTNSATIFNKNYKDIIRITREPLMQNRLRNSGLIREYAFTDSFELIAVLVELYFEKQTALKTSFPQIYRLVAMMLSQKPD